MLTFFSLIGLVILSSIFVYIVYQIKEDNIDIGITEIVIFFFIVSIIVLIVGIFSWLFVDDEIGINLMRYSAIVFGVGSLIHIFFILFKHSEKIISENGLKSILKVILSLLIAIFIYLIFIQKYIFAFFLFLIIVFLFFTGDDYIEHIFKKPNDTNEENMEELNENYNQKNSRKHNIKKIK